MRVPDAFVFHAAHGHFHFPLAAFGLYAVAPDGGIGAPVAVSPKNGFCIDDSYIYDNTVVHAGAFIGTKGSCADPTTLRGLTVGAADEYDFRDPGPGDPVRRRARRDLLVPGDVATPTTTSSRPTRPTTRPT